MPFQIVRKTILLYAFVGFYFKSQLVFSLTDENQFTIEERSETSRRQLGIKMADLIVELSQSQISLMDTLAEKAAHDAKGSKVTKRGYMNLVTELSRTELSRAARAKSIAAQQAAAAAAAAAADVRASASS